MFLEHKPIPGIAQRTILPTDDAVPKRINIVADWPCLRNERAPRSLLSPGLAEKIVRRGVVGLAVGLYGTAAAEGGSV